MLLHPDSPSLYGRPWSYPIHQAPVDEVGFTYHQRSGELRDALGHRVAIGYSGREEGKNNPALERADNLGPIPCGFYRIGVPFTSRAQGYQAMRLTPLEGTDTFGRTGFHITSDSLFHKGHASHGCIILGLMARRVLAASRARILWVVE